MIYIGIDPGVTGAVAVLQEGGVRVEDTPVTKGTRPAFLPYDMAPLLSPYRGCAVAVLEEVSTRYGLAAQAVLKTGYGGGLWAGMLAALEIPVQVIRPQEWKEVYGLINRDKNESRALALKLYPSLAPELKRIKDHGRAEAVLLADYCKRLRW